MEKDPYSPIAEIEAIIDQIPPQNIGEAITAIIIFEREEELQHNIPGIESLLQGIKDAKFDTNDILKSLETKYHLQYSLAEAQKTSQKPSKNTPANQQKRIKLKVSKAMFKTSHRTFSKKGGSLMKTSHGKTQRLCTTTKNKRKGE